MNVKLKATPAKLKVDLTKKWRWKHCRNCDRAIFIHQHQEHLLSFRFVKFRKRLLLLSNHVFFIYLFFYCNTPCPLQCCYYRDLHRGDDVEIDSFRCVLFGVFQAIFLHNVLLAFYKLKLNYNRPKTTNIRVFRYLPGTFAFLFCCSEFYLIPKNFFLTLLLLRIY